MNDKEIHRLALEVARLLNGMSVGMARNVLSCADSLVQLGTKLDIDAPMFQGEVATYNQRFRDAAQIGTKITLTDDRKPYGID